MDQVRSIAVFVFLFPLFLYVLERSRSRYPRLVRVVGYLLLLVYVLANLKETILFRKVMDRRAGMWQMLESYRYAFALPEGWRGLFTGAVQVTDDDLMVEILLNILLYIPLGYLLPFTFPKIRGFWVIATGAVCSVLTELTQLIFRIGLFEYDDMMNNTMGCVMGLLLYVLLFRKSRKGAESS